MIGKTLVGIGVWLFSDSLYSLLIYLGRPEEKWWKNHSIRVIRLVLGIAIVIIGYGL